MGNANAAAVPQSDEELHSFVLRLLRDDRELKEVSEALLEDVDDVVSVAELQPLTQRLIDRLSCRQPATLERISAVYETVADREELSLVEFHGYVACVLTQILRELEERREGPAPEPAEVPAAPAEAPAPFAATLGDVPEPLSDLQRLALELNSLKETLEGSHDLPVTLAPELPEVIPEAKVEPVAEVVEPKTEPRAMDELLASLDDLVFYTNNLKQKQAPQAPAPAALPARAVPAPVRAAPPVVPVMPAVAEALQRGPPQVPAETHSLEPVFEPVFPNGPQQWRQLPAEQFSGPCQPDQHLPMSGRPLQPHPPQDMVRDHLSKHKAASEARPDWVNSRLSGATTGIAYTWQAFAETMDSIFVPGEVQVPTEEAEAEVTVPDVSEPMPRAEDVPVIFRQPTVEEVREVLEEEGLPAYVAVASARTFCPKKLCMDSSSSYLYVLEPDSSIPSVFFGMNGFCLDDLRRIVLSEELLDPEAKPLLSLEFQEGFLPVRLGNVLVLRGLVGVLCQGRQVQILQSGP